MQPSRLGSFSLRRPSRQRQTRWHAGVELWMLLSALLAPIGIVDGKSGSSVVFDDGSMVMGAEEDLLSLRRLQAATNPSPSREVLRYGGVYLSTLAHSNCSAPCCGGPVNPEPIVFGTTIDILHLERSLLHAYQLFFKWVNGDRGGICINGIRRPVEVVILDAGSGNVSDAMEYLANTTNVSLFYGTHGDDEVESMTDIAATQTDNMVIISPGSFDTDFFKDRPNVFGMLPKETGVVKSIFKVLDGRVKTYARIQEVGDDLCTDVVPDVAGAQSPQVVPVRGGGLIQVARNTTASEYIKLAKDLRQLKPDLVLGCIWIPEVCTGVVKAFKAINYEPKMLAMTHCVGEVNFDAELDIVDDKSWILGTTAKDGLLSQASSWATGWNQQKVEEAFALNFEQEHPPYEASAIWAASSLYMSAIEATNSTEPAVVRQHLKGVDTQTVFGRVVFDSDGQNDHPWKVIQFQGGDWHEADLSASPGKLIFPMPPWRERRCRTAGGVDVGSRYDDNMIYGYYTPKSYYEYDPPRLEDLEDWVINPKRLGGAAYFAADIMGYTHADCMRKANETAQWVKTTLRGAENKTLNHTEAADWVRDCLNQVFISEEPLNRLLVSDAAVAYFLAPNQKSPICTPCPKGFAALWDDDSQKRLCSKCGDQLTFKETYAVQRALVTDVLQVRRECLQLCPDGQGKEDADDASCDVCAPGRASFHGYCEACPRGRFAAAAGSSVCDACLPGKYSNSTESTECLDCDPGHEATAEGSQSCELCTRGTTAAQAGTSSCELCPAGSISPGLGGTECQSCKPGSYSVWGATECAQCEKGKYQNRYAQDHCISGTNGAKFNATNLTRGENLPGFWARQRLIVNSGVSASRTNITEEYKVKWDFCSSFPKGCLPEEKCQKGATGQLCESCASGYGHTGFLQADAACFKCPDIQYNIVATDVVILGVLCFSIIIVVSVVKSSHRPQDMQILCFKVLLFYAIVANVLSITMNEIVLQRRQAIGEAATEMNFVIGTFLMMFQGSILSDTPAWSLHCLFQDIMHRLYLDEVTVALMKKAETLQMSDWFGVENDELRKELGKMHALSEAGVILFWAFFPTLLTVVASVLLAIYLVFKMCIKGPFYRRSLRFLDDLVNMPLEEVLNKEEMQEGGKAKWMSYVREYHHKILSLFWPLVYADYGRRARCCFWLPLFLREVWPLAITIYLIVFGGCMTGILRAFRCKPYGQDWSADPTLYMVMAPEVTCFDMEQPLLLVAAFAVLVLGVFTPLVLFLFTWKYHRRFEDDESLRTKFSILCHGYVENCWWWESFAFLAKTIIMCTAHSNATPEAKNGHMLLLAIMYATVAVVVNPFDSHGDHIIRKLDGQFTVTWIVHCVMVEFIVLQPPYVEGDQECSSFMNEGKCPDYCTWADNKCWKSCSHFWDQDTCPAHCSWEDGRCYKSGFHWSMLCMGILLIAHLSFLGTMTKVMYDRCVETYMATFDWLGFERELEEAKTFKPTGILGPFKVWIKKFLMRSHEQHHKQAPYVYMDPLFGWAVVCGSRGDLSIPPKIPRGRLPNLPKGRPALSEVPTIPEEVEVKQATPQQRLWLQKALSLTMEVLGTRLESPTFSVSLVEFTMRAAFVLSRTRNLVIPQQDTKAAMSHWHDHDGTMDFAAAELDLLDIVERKDKAMAEQVTSKDEMAKHQRAKQLTEPKGSSQHLDESLLDDELVTQAFRKLAEFVQEKERARRGMELDTFADHPGDGTGSASVAFPATPLSAATASSGMDSMDSRYYAGSTGSSSVGGSRSSLGRLSSRRKSKKRYKRPQIRHYLSSMDFDGSYSCFADLAPATVALGGDMSISFSVRFDTFGETTETGNKTVLEFGDEDTSHSITIANVGNTNKLWISVKNDETHRHPSPSFEVEDAINLGQLQQFLFTIDHTGHAELWREGVLLKAAAMSGGAPHKVKRKFLLVGREINHNGNTMFQGAIRGLKVWSEVLRWKDVQKADVKERHMETLVTAMFHPATFATGIELETLQLSMLELQRWPRYDLELALDLFEEHWAKHNEFLSNRIKRYSGAVRDEVQQTLGHSSIGPPPSQMRRSVLGPDGAPPTGEEFAAAGGRAGRKDSKAQLSLQFFLHLQEYNLADFEEKRRETYIGHIQKHLGCDMVEIDSMKEGSCIIETIAVGFVSEAHAHNAEMRIRHSEALEARVWGKYVIPDPPRRILRMHRASPWLQAQQTKFKFDGRLNPYGSDKKEAPMEGIDEVEWQMKSKEASAQRKEAADAFHKACMKAQIEAEEALHEEELVEEPGQLGEVGAVLAWARFVILAGRGLQEGHKIDLGAAGSAIKKRREKKEAQIQEQLEQEKAALEKNQQLLDQMRAEVEKAKRAKTLQGPSGAPNKAPAQPVPPLQGLGAALEKASAENK
eukprot:TRINITY_DN14336_c0_g2_i1.p1 TRINITY_DN14336_c0_g2~~TRINITY_DN14336_c0_g2_i1.p1  ORF type:complete len:2392 (+),score=532.93 TRINITY_DN14336_c0_g2_i1:170-7345(+)